MTGGPPAELAHFPRATCAFLIIAAHLPRFFPPPSCARSLRAASVKSPAPCKEHTAALQQQQEPDHIQSRSPPISGAHAAAPPPPSSSRDNVRSYFSSPADYVRSPRTFRGRVVAVPFRGVGASPSLSFRFFLLPPPTTREPAEYMKKAIDDSRRPSCQTFFRLEPPTNRDENERTTTTWQGGGSHAEPEVRRGHTNVCIT